MIIAHQFQFYKFIQGLIIIGLGLFWLLGCQTSSKHESSSTTLETFPISVNAPITISQDGFEVLEPAGFDWDQDAPSNVKQNSTLDSVTLSAKYCSTKLSAGKYLVKFEGTNITIEKVGTTSESFNILKKFTNGPKSDNSSDTNLEGKVIFGPLIVDRGQIAQSTIEIVLPKISFSKKTLSITYNCQIKSGSKSG